MDAPTLFWVILPTILGVTVVAVSLWCLFRSFCLVQLLLAAPVVIQCSLSVWDLLRTSTPGTYVPHFLIGFAVLIATAQLLLLRDARR